MRVPILALVVFSLVALAQEAIPEPADWRFAHPNATLVGGVRLQALLESPIIAAMFDEATSKDPSVGAVVGMARAALGGVEELRFSLRDAGMKAAGASEMDALVLVAGEMDPSLAEALSQGKVQFRRLDSRTILLGADASLAEALHRMDAPPTVLQNRALVHGAAIAPSYDLWIAGNLPDTPMTSAVNLNLRGLMLGVSMAGNLGIEMALDATTTEMAEGLIRMAREAEAQQPQLAGRLETSIEGTTAHFRVTVPREDVLEAIRQGKAADLFTQLGGVIPGSTPPTVAPEAEPPFPPPPPAPPKRKTIIIQGLEGGSREIPLDGVH